MQGLFEFVDRRIGAAHDDAGALGAVVGQFAIVDAGREGPVGPEQHVFGAETATDREGVRQGARHEVDALGRDQLLQVHVLLVLADAELAVRPDHPLAVDVQPLVGARVVADEELGVLLVLQAEDDLGATELGIVDEVPDVVVEPVRIGLQDAVHKSVIVADAVELVFGLHRQGQRAGHGQDGQSTDK